MPSESLSSAYMQWMDRFAFSPALSSSCTTQIGSSRARTSSTTVSNRHAAAVLARTQTVQRYTRGQLIPTFATASQSLSSLGVYGVLACMAYGVSVCMLSVINIVINITFANTSIECGRVSLRRCSDQVPPTHTPHTHHHHHHGPVSSRTFGHVYTRTCVELQVKLVHCDCDFDCGRWRDDLPSLACSWA